MQTATVLPAASFGIGVDIVGTFLTRPDRNERPGCQLAGRALLREQDLFNRQVLVFFVDPLSLRVLQFDARAPRGDLERSEQHDH